VRFIFFNSFTSTAVAPVAFHYVTRIFHTPVGAISMAVLLSKMHKFHSVIVIRYYARSRFRDTLLPVSAGGGQVIYSGNRASPSFSLNTAACVIRELRSTLLYIRLSTHISSPRRPLCLSQRWLRFFSPLVQTSFDNGKKRCTRKERTSKTTTTHVYRERKYGEKKLILNTMPKRTRRPF